MKNSLLFASLLLWAINSTATEWKDVCLKSKVCDVQPMTGLVLWPDLAEDKYEAYGKSHALEYSYIAPCKVVTGCSEDGTVQYDWTYLDNILDGIKARNHQAILRFFYVYPGEKMVDDKKGTTAVPAYIKALPDYHETYKKVAGDGETYYADWSNSELKRFTKQFFTDFAARYGNDPRIAFMEVGFGHWAEYHIYDDNGVDLQFGKNFPTKEYQKEFFQHLTQVLPIPWAISIDASDSFYSPFTQDEEMMAMPFGLFDDSFMHKDHEIGSKDGYNEECWNKMGANRWETGVCGGEISYYKSSDQKNFTNPAGMYGHTWEEQAAKYHISFMIANDNPGGKNSYNTPTRFKECSMATGYHFEVTACQTDGQETKITVTNKGVAPLYRDAFFAIGSSRSGETLRGLLPGNSLNITIPVALDCEADGSPKTLPTIACDYILDTQKIEYDSNLVPASITAATHGKATSAAPCYNLNGIKVPADSKGFMIRNGKKTYRHN